MMTDKDYCDSINRWLYEIRATRRMREIVIEIIDICGAEHAFHTVLAWRNTYRP